MSILTIEDKLLKCNALVKILKSFNVKSLSFVLQPMMIVENGNECGVMALWATGDDIANNDAMTATLVISASNSMHLKHIPSTELCIMSNDKDYITCNIKDIEKSIDFMFQNQVILNEQFMQNMYKLIDAIDYALSNKYDLFLAHTVDLRVIAPIANAGQSLEEVAILREITL